MYIVFGMFKNLTNFLGGQKARAVAIFLGLYLTSAGVSWAAFSFAAGGVEIISPIGVEQKRARLDLNAPKTETCPLTGSKFTKAEREIWEKRRPLTVMIENHQEARPQSGLGRADVIYEAVAEGGITRFLVVFYCGGAASDLTIGPVRSARIYFMDWGSEYADWPLYVHVGGANRGLADALGAIAKYGWLENGNDINQFSVGFPTFWRDYERIGHPVATEHTMYASTDKLWELAAQERGLSEKNKDGDKWDSNFVSWKFEEAGLPGSVTQIEFPFWESQPDYSVRWVWDATTNSWKRENGGQSHTDLNNKEQLVAKNVIVLFTKERSLGDLEKHMLYTTTGEGRAIVFKNGQAIEGTWEKGERTARTKFFDAKGKEISLAPGSIWIEVLPTGTEVTY